MTLQEFTWKKDKDEVQCHALKCMNCPDCVFKKKIKNKK